ncbi:cytochrome P450, partial [Mycena olivaceomarginata]
LDIVPVIGSSSFLSSYWDALKFLHHAPNLIQRGYDQYPRGILRRLFRWEYVVCSPKLIKDIAGTPDNVVSFAAGVEVFSLLLLRFSYSPHWQSLQYPYHHRAIRTTLTRNLHACFPEVKDEIVCVFNDVLRPRGSECKALPVLPTMMVIVARVSNRLFVGLPLCRNKVYLANNVCYTIGVVRTVRKFSLFPLFLRPQVPSLLDLTKLDSNARALPLTGPLIEERLSKERELSPDWPGKPNDFISWLLDFAEGEERVALSLMVRILIMNMVAIHITSMAFTHALFDLMTYPEYLVLMREEAERVGWTKGLNSIVKIDSFLESQRINTNGPGVFISGFSPFAKDGLRFSNGFVFPYGAYLSVASQPTHYDNSKYDNAAMFDGFRFARERAEHLANHSRNDNQDIFKRHMISTAMDHLPFGTGKHACPGRFFAATELKAMMAHLVINYDVQAEVEGVRPANKVFDATITPSTTGKVRFKKRQ